MSIFDRHGFDRQSAEDILIDAVGLGSAGKAIEAQEARGQQALVHADVIPTQGTKNEEPWIALGFVLGPQVDGDNLFRHCTYPQGWTKKATGHSLYSDIVDDKGRVRGQIGFKAAVY